MQFSVYLFAINVLRVFVIKGKVFDVALDIRKGSPWYGKYVYAILEPSYAMWIPPGFAHGFQAIEETLFMYLVTKEYAQNSERCIVWNDPNLNIPWPMKEKAIVSEKDKQGKFFKEAETNFESP